jgi:hypothetical protein
MKRLSIFLFSLLVITGFACSPFIASSQPEPASADPVTEPQVEVSQEPTSIPMQTETPTPAPAFNPTTYRDETTGFEFDYPAEWSFDPGEQQPRGGYVQFFSWEWNPGDPIETVPAGGSALTVTVLNWDPKNDLKAFVDQRKLGWESSGSSIISEERFSLVGDRPAAQFTVQGVDGARAFFLFTTVDKQYLTFSGNGDLDLLADIAHTLRPIQ